MGRNAKSSKIQDIPDLIQQPNFDWRRVDFEAFLYHKGYEVFHDKAVRCPCKVKGSQYLSSCKNCRGTGWVFINRTETRMVLTSMNVNTSFKEWSEQNVGTVNVTASSNDRLGYMDRITIRNGESVLQEVLSPIDFKGQMFAYTIYDIVSIREVFMFVAENIKLRLLTEGIDYTYEQNILKFSNEFKSVSNFSVSVTYNYNTQYHVIDITRDIRNQFNKDDGGVDVSVSYPILAVARRSHYQLDAENYVGNLILDNSYDTD